MGTVLIRHAERLVTMDTARREIADGAIYFEDHVIRWVGKSADIPLELRYSADQIIEAKGKVILPGFINTHHHFYQTLTRALPHAQNVGLFDWLKTLYPIWANLTPQAIYISTQLALTELLLSGCTTSSDHHYLWPNGARLDDQFEAAEIVGTRFHGARGSMSLGESDGGLPPDRIVEDERHILADCQRVVETYHQKERYAMRRVVIAPCSPFSVTADLMRESANLARSFGSEMNVHLHTHLAETKDEEQFCMETFGYRPSQYAQKLGWMGDDVWHAHCVHVSPAEIGMFARSRTGVAHCPTSNMRLASGIAPIRMMLDAGVPVGLGVDGSASNDSSHMLAEVRQAMLLQRVLSDPSAMMTARQAIEMATLGGAAVLGRDDIGALSEGMAADLIAFDLSGIGHAGGAIHDPVAALVFCQPTTIDFAFIHGNLRVWEGRPLRFELPILIEKHNRIARELLL